jgi:homoserine O-acetyltransferase
MPSRQAYWASLTRSIYLLLAFTAAALPAQADNDLIMADLGNCELENGQRINDCKIGYRTYGQLNADKTNVVLMPTWYNGSAADLEKYDYLGSGKIVDTDRYYVVAVNALGNGISSSPSNHSTPAAEAFPELSIRDMVHTQHRLLTEKLGLQQIHAVVGVSLGGYQAYEWMMLYPRFAKHFVPIEGTPWPTHYDQLLWTAWQQSLQGDLDEPVNAQRAADLLTAVDALTLWTPGYVNRENRDTAFPDYFNRIRRKSDPAYLHDRASQTAALFTHDIRAPYTDFDQHVQSLQDLSVLAVVFESDLMVNPEPNRELAAMMGFEVMEVPGDCGHMGPNPECYQQAVAEKVQQFLAQETSPTPGMDRHVMTHGGIEREYFVHVPHTVQAGKALPVVLALHGYGTTATGFQAIYNLNQHADEHGYIVIYPQGTHFMGAFGTDPTVEKFLITTWNDQVSNFTPSPAGGPHCTEDRLQYPCPPECGSCNHCAWVSCHDDFGFLNRLMDEVQADYATDMERYYLLGNSNGGTLAMRLACDMPARFAAVVSITIQMPPGYECAPDRSLPLLHLYGEKDDMTGHDGTATSGGWIFASAADTAKKWAASLDCAEHAAPWHNDISDANDLRCVAYSECRVPEHKVLSCMDPEASHEWRGQRLAQIPADCVSPEQQPSLPGQPLCPTPDPQAVEQQWGMDFVWQFLNQYRRTETP